jgi:hypothetical protein
MIGGEGGIDAEVGIFVLADALARLLGGHIKVNARMVK